MTNTYDIKDLTLEQKVGQLLMFGFDALTLNNHAIEMIQKYHIGNVILFTRNVKTPEQVFLLNQQLQKLALASNGVPLFIGIDQEGGMVSRIHQATTSFPGAMTTSANGSLDDCYHLGYLTGQELKAMGVNMNFAPILDVNSNPKNPIIGVRSFSDDKETVSAYAIASMKGLQEHVIATGKHFPGHGDTSQDSHLTLPRIDKTREALDEVEFVPFKNAIKAGIKAIMSTHIDFPAMTENGLPATLSKRVLTGLLREEFGFEGLIISDGMQMKAIQDNYGTVEATLMAIEVGIDIACICHSYDLQKEAAIRLRNAVKNNILDETILNDRVHRILKAKSELDINVNQTYDDVKALIHSSEAVLLSTKIAEGAVTLVKGENYQPKEKTLFIGPMPKATSIADEKADSIDTFKRIEHETLLDTYQVSISPTKEEIASTIALANQYETLVIATYNGNVYHEQITLIEALSQLNKQIFVLAMRNPYDLYYTNKIKNYICFYEYTKPSVDALIAYLKGELIPQGKVPVKYE